MPYFQQYQLYVIALSAIISIIGFVLALVAVFANGALKRRLKRWKSIRATADLEEVYDRTVKQVEQLRQELGETRQIIEQLQEQVRRKVSTARVMRYNAFAETGSDLSFSVALLDGNGDGVVISSIYGRDESRTYAKPVKAGTSTYTLTDEELQVIRGDHEKVESRRSVNV